MCAKKPRQQNKAKLVGKAKPIRLLSDFEEADVDNGIWGRRRVEK